MQVQVPTVTAVCEVAVRHDRCRGQVYSLLGDQPCGCPCHQPDPIEEEELEALLELEAEHFGEVA